MRKTSALGPEKNGHFRFNVQYPDSYFITVLNDIGLVLKQSSRGWKGSVAAIGGMPAERLFVKGSTVKAVMEISRSRSHGQAC